MSLVSIIRKIDYRVFFPFLSEGASQKYYVQREDSTYSYAKAALKDSPALVSVYFEYCAKVWQRRKYHYYYTEGCTVEPTFGWGITNADELIPQSLWNNYTDGIKPSYLKFKLVPKKKLHLKVAISLHYAWTNYWHFYNDILGQLRLADDAGISTDTPIIISAGLAKLKFFKEIMAMSSELQGRNWVYQDEKTNIYCDSIHFFNTFYGHRNNFDAVLGYIKFNEFLKSSLVGEKRIFVNRNKKRGRNILNINEVTRILEKYSFEIIECDNLSIRQQIDVFQNAVHVIGIHGAGLTNIVYRQGKPMNLLEIFLADYINPTYFWLCQQYEYDYYSMVGNGDADAKSTINNFTIDVQEFERKIMSMLKI